MAVGKYENQVSLTYWERIRRDWLSWDGWFTWDAWLLRAYRNRINYRSFLSDPPLHITDDIKDTLLDTHRDDILNAIKNNSHENAYKKTVLHYIGKTAIYLLALSYGFVVSFMVGAHLNVAGRIASELVTWLFFTTTYLAYTAIYGKSVPELAEKLLYKDKNKNWHFFESKELEIYMGPEGECGAGFWNKDTKAHDLNAAAATFSFREKMVGVIFLGFVLVVATVAASLSVTKAPAAMATMKSLSFMSVMFGPIGFALAAATFVCTLGLLLNAVVKLLKKENKLEDFYKLFYWGHDPEVGTARKYATNVLTGIFLIGVLALVGFGMYGSSTVEAQDFMKLAHSGRNLSGRIVIASAAMIGKLVFSLSAAVNGMRLGMRACVVGYRATCEYFSGSKNKNVDLNIVSKKDGDAQPEGYKLAAVGVNAICQPAKTTQPPAPQDPDDPDSDLDPSPFFEGSSMGLFMLWVTGAGASLRAVNAGVEQIKPHEDKPANKGYKSS